MKAILEFNLETEEDKLEHLRAINATNAFGVIWDTTQEIFRPARKHGYSGEYGCDELNKLLNDETCGDKVREAISLLESRFYKILEFRHINLDLYN